MENLVYALVQLMHNFGAATVVAVPVLAMFLASRGTTLAQNGLLLAVLVGWSVQIASGLGFAATSWHFHGELPEVESVALWALLIKITCSVTALLFIAYGWSRTSSKRNAKPLWTVLLTVAAVALAAAAFLRWYV